MNAFVSADGMTPRIAVLTNAIPAYRYPLFDALTKHAGANLRIYLSLPLERSTSQAQATLPLSFSRGINLRWRTRHGGVGRDQTEFLHIPLRLIYDLMSYRPHVIISGELGLRSLAAWGIAKILGSSLVLWSEEIPATALGASRVQRALRAFLISRARALLAWGEPAAAYLRSFGVAEDAIYPCIQAVDNDYWAKRVRALNRGEARSELGVRGRIFISVSQLIPRKGIDLLIRAWGALPEDCRRDNTLIIVGGGEEEPRLRRLAMDSQGIEFAGQLAQDELARYYYAADVFVFPTLVDVWGLVVNEAMACGLPVLASRHAGVAQGLVAGSGAGEVFDPLDHSGFVDALQRWCMREVLPARDSVSRAVADYRPEPTVEAFLRVINDCLARPAAASRSDAKT